MSITFSILREQFPGKLLLTLDEVAPLIGFTRGGVANLISSKNFPISTRKVGGRRLVPIAALARFLDQEDQPTEAPAQRKRPGPHRKFADGGAV